MKKIADFLGIPVIFIQLLLIGLGVVLVVAVAKYFIGIFTAKKKAKELTDAIKNASDPETRKQLLEAQAKALLIKWTPYRDGSGWVASWSSPLEAEAQAVNTLSADDTRLVNNFVTATQPDVNLARIFLYTNVITSYRLVTSDTGKVLATKLSNLGISYGF